MFDVVLTGCRPEPLASYLKALGVLRLVAEQKDKDAQGFWQGEHFVLRSSLDEKSLARFFAAEWRPTPVIAPWNGGSGFYPKDNQQALQTLSSSSDDRLSGYRETIAVAVSIVAAHGWTERPEGEAKAALLDLLRASLSDEALPWLDAAVVLGDERPMFPPLLGTGGNDGRLDFSNNFMQRVVATLDDDGRLLRASLFDAPESIKYQGAMGLYAPAADVRTNPWDFVYLIEGALLFAGAATRRLASLKPGTLAFPFHARAAGGVATLAVTDEGKSRDELWLPMWRRPSSLRELHALLAEGRAKVGTKDGDERDAQTALDFARAIARIGTDRGLVGFARFGFHERNGLAYFATPLGRFNVDDVGDARLLDEVDSWFGRFRRAAFGDRAPAAVARAGRALEDALFSVASGSEPALALLALADAEQSLTRALSFADKSFLKPLPCLAPPWWDVVEDSLEARLGICLGRRHGIRGRLLALDAKKPWEWGRADDAGFVFTNRPLIDNLHALLLREDIEAQQGRGLTPQDASDPARLDDICAFIDGDADDELIERWARAATLLPQRGEHRQADDGAHLPPATFAVLALVQHGELLDDTPLKRTSTLLARACAGDAAGATAAALRRLDAVGRPMPVDALMESTERTRRIAAALAFPLSRSQRRRLESMVLPPSSASKTANQKEAEQ